MNACLEINTEITWTHCRNQYKEKLTLLKNCKNIISTKSLYQEHKDTLKLNCIMLLGFPLIHYLLYESLLAVLASLTFLIFSALNVINLLGPLSYSV
jgi:type III secretory pathway component EscU